MVHRHHETRRQLHGTDSAYKLAAREKLELFWDDRMYLEFNDMLVREGDDSSQPLRRIEWRQCKEKICHQVTATQNRVHGSTIKPVCESLFTSLKREVSSNDRTDRNQAPKNHVRGQMHVMMAINALWRATIKPLKLVQLRPCNVLEGL